MKKTEEKEGEKESRASEKEEKARLEIPRSSKVIYRANKVTCSFLLLLLLAARATQHGELLIST